MHKSNPSPSALHFVLLGSAIGFVFPAIMILFRQNPKVMLYDAWAMPFCLAGFGYYLAKCQARSAQLLNRAGGIELLARQLEHAQATANIGSWKLNTKTQDLFWSPHLYKIYQVNLDTPSTEIFNKFVERIHPEDRTQALSLIQSQLDIQENYETYFRIVLEDGSSRHIHSNIEFEKDAHGDLVYILGTAQDVTEQLTSQDELKKRTKEVDNFFSISIDMFCILERSTQIKRMNLSFAKTLGVEPDALSGQFLLSHTHPDDESAVRSALTALLQSGQTISFDCRLRKGDGTYRRMSWRASFDSQTELIYATGRDVTNRKEREHRLQQIIDQSPAGIFLKDQQGRFLLANRAFSQMTEREPAQLVGKTTFELNPPELAAHFTKRDRGVIESAKPYTSTELLPTPRGPEWHLVTLFPLFDQDKHVVALGGTLLNIHLQKQLEDQLIAAQEIAKIGSWRYDFTTGHQLWSHELFRIFELSEDLPPDKVFAAYRARIHADDVATLDAHMQNAWAHGTDFIFDHRVSLDNGTRIKFVQGIGKVKKDDTGRPVAITGTCQDRTLQVEMELSLEKERAKSIHNAKLASLGEMSAGIAHEINNPLAIIEGATRSLRKNAIEPESLKAKIEVIERATQRIAKIVTGLRKFSRTSGHEELKPHPVQILLGEAVTLTEARVKRHSVALHLIGDTSAKILCNEIEIEQVLVNLINNAVDAVKNLSERWIQIQVSETSHQITVQIRDSGAGIPKAIADKLFQPFFTTKPVGEGTGLGLSITKGILDEHGAQIHILQTEAHTCFEIVFTKHLGAQHAS